MTAGQTIYRLSVFSDDPFAGSSISSGVVTDIVLDGQRYVRREFGTMEPIGPAWHESKAEAKAELRRLMVRYIGGLQAKADELGDEIMHEHLTSEVPA